MESIYSVMFHCLTVGTADDPRIPKSIFYFLSNNTNQLLHFSAISKEINISWPKPSFLIQPAGCRDMKTNVIHSTRGFYLQGPTKRKTDPGLCFIDINASAYNKTGVSLTESDRLYNVLWTADSFNGNEIMVISLTCSLKLKLFYRLLMGG